MAASACLDLVLAAPLSPSEGYATADSDSRWYGGVTIGFTDRGSMVERALLLRVDPDTRTSWSSRLRFTGSGAANELNRRGRCARASARFSKRSRHDHDGLAAVPAASLAPAPGPPGGLGGGPGTIGAPRHSGADSRPDDRPTLGAGGGIIHEVGCVRMGDNPKDSVVNKFCQAHEVPNLFSADGGPFVSHGDKNPTHTIIALAWRTAEYLAEELRKGNV